jgi:hypothetical protein
MMSRSPLALAICPPAKIVRDLRPVTTSTTGDILVATGFSLRTSPVAEGAPIKGAATKAIACDEGAPIRRAATRTFACGEAACFQPVPTQRLQTKTAPSRGPKRSNEIVLWGAGRRR